MSLWKAATTNAFNTTLNGNIGVADASITITSASGLQAPGIIVIDRVNTAGTSTPIVREYISFTGISTNTLTGCSRGLGGSTGQSHQSGAVVEEVMDVNKWNDLYTALLNVFTSSGALDTTKVMDLSSSQSASNKTLTSPTLSGTVGGSPTFSGKPIFTATQQTLVADSDGATITFNMNSGNYHQVTLGGNRTLAVSNVGSPQAFIIQLKQDATGSRTVTWFSNINWPGGSAPTLTTTAAKMDTFGFLYDGSVYWGFIVGQNS